MKIQEIPDAIGGAVVSLAIVSGFALFFIVIAVGSTLSEITERSPRPVGKKQSKSFRSPALSHSL